MVTNSDPDDFQLIPPFRSQLGPVSLIQIFPYNLLYPQPSDDPVFYANKKICLKDKPTACSWTRAPSVASVLACVDINEYCVDNPRQCFRPGYSTKRSIHIQSYSLDTNAGAALLLLGVVMGAATINDAFSIRLAQALEVQALVAQQQMTSVQNGNWKSEVENLFQLSLAMLQNRVVDIANGAFHDQPYVVNLLEKEGPGRVDWSAMCNQVLVQAPGFQSVSLLGVLSVLVMTLFIIVVSINPEGKLVIFDFLAPFFNQLWYVSKLLYGTASAFLWQMLKASWNFVGERVRRPGILLWEKRGLYGRWLMRQVKALADIVVVAISNLLSLPIRLSDFLARRSTVDGRIRLEST